MYTNKELECLVQDSLTTLLYLNPKEVIDKFVKGEKIDFNYFLNNLAYPFDLKDSKINKCLNKCIFNSSVASISFVEFDDPYKYYDESIRPIYHCFLNETNQSFYFSVFIPYEYEKYLEENDIRFLIDFVSESSHLIKKIYIPEWDYIET